MQNRILKSRLSLSSVHAPSNTGPHVPTATRSPDQPRQSVPQGHHCKDPSFRTQSHRRRRNSRPPPKKTRISRQMFRRRLPDSSSRMTWSGGERGREGGRSDFRFHVPGSRVQASGSVDWSTIAISVFLVPCYLSRRGKSIAQVDEERGTRIHPGILL